MIKKLGTIFKGDRVIWSVIAGLLFYSLLAVYSASVSVAFARYGGNTTFFLRSQIFLVLFCLLIIVVTHNLPYRIYSSLAGFFVVVSIILLIITPIIGVEINSAVRSIEIPGTGVRVQTSEVAKVSLIIYYARMLSKYQNQLNDFKLLTRVFIVPLGIVAILIMPENLSTALMVFGISMVVLFIGRVPMKFLLTWTVGALLAVILIALLLDAVTDANRVATWKGRIEAFVTGSEDNPDAHYQSDQAKIAIANGGLMGKAPGNSIQRNMLPQSNSDFIFAIIIEEYGFLFGALPLLLLFLILLFRGIAIARKCETAFPAFLAMGLTLMIVFQAMLNMAVAVGIFPVTGQTLPMISWGRFSMLVTSFSLGVILGVSRVVKARQNNEDLEDEEIQMIEDEVIYEGATT
ncbi:MAG: FtsW/RodA/SpoVE family cell cycle protein [Bacteroidales bacterium]|nr:FtsW/RodA/SpoVE family cell cycle protein [Bacteroidales bacterium]